MIFNMTSYPVGSAGPEGYTIVNALYSRNGAYFEIPNILYEGRQIEVSINELGCASNTWRMVFTYNVGGSIYGMSYDSFQSDTQDHFGIYAQGGSTSGGRFAVTWPNTLTFEAIAQTGFKCYYGDRLIRQATPRTGSTYPTTFGLFGPAKSNYTPIEQWEVTKITVYNSDKTEVLDTLLPCIRDADGVCGWINESGTFVSATAGTVFFK